MKYTIKFEKKQDGSYINIPIVELVKENESIGDIVGIYKDCNCLVVDEYIDIDDEEIKEFIKEHFKDYRAVLGFIRRIL